VKRVVKAGIPSSLLEVYTRVMLLRWVCLPMYHGGYALLCTMVGIHLPIHPGYTYARYMPTVRHRVRWSCRGAGRRGSGLNGENSLVPEAKRGLPAPKGVTVLRHSCAELLRLSGKKVLKDWIAIG